MSFFSNQRKVMEKVFSLQANVTKTLLELKTNATLQLKALKDNVDRRMAQSLVASLALFKGNGGATATSPMGSPVGDGGQVRGNVTVADNEVSGGTSGNISGGTSGNINGGASGNVNGRSSSNGDGGAGGSVQTPPPREFTNSKITRSGLALSMLQPNAANGSSDDENARRNAGKQASPDDRVMPAQDQQEGSGLGANPLKRFRRQAAFNGKTERPPGGTDAFAPGGGVTAPKETLRSSLVLPTDNLFSAPSPTVGSPTPEVVGDLAAGLKANLADLEFLLQSYRIDAEELLINRHLLTATSDMNMFFIQMDNIAKG